MLQGGFDPHRRSISREKGGQFSCMWVLPFVKLSYHQQLGQQPKANMLQRRHSSLICERPIIWSMNFNCLQNMHIRFTFEHVCFPILYMYHEALHLSRHPNSENTIFTKCPNLMTSIWRPSDLQLVGKMIIFCTHLRYEVGLYMQVVDQNKC